MPMYIWDLKVTDEVSKPVEFYCDGNQEEAAEIGRQYGPGKLRPCSESPRARTIVVRHPDEDPYK